MRAFLLIALVISLAAPLAAPRAAHAQGPGQTESDCYADEAVCKNKCRGRSNEIAMAQIIGALNNKAIHSGFNLDNCLASCVRKADSCVKVVQREREQAQAQAQREREDQQRQARYEAEERKRQQDKAAIQAQVAGRAPSFTVACTARSGTGGSLEISVWEQDGICNMGGVQRCETSGPVIRMKEQDFSLNRANGVATSRWYNSAKDYVESVQYDCVKAERAKYKF